MAQPTDPPRSGQWGPYSNIACGTAIRFDCDHPVDSSAGSVSTPTGQAVLAHTKAMIVRSGDQGLPRRTGAPAQRLTGRHSQWSSGAMSRGD